MKKLQMASILLGGVLVLGACGAKEEQPVNDTPTDQPAPSTSQQETHTNENSTPVGPTEGTATSQDEMQKQMADLPYKEFELEAKYGTNQEYEAKVQIESDNTVEAKLEDELTNKKLKGSDAFNHLYPLLQGLTLTAETSQEEAIAQVLQAFDLQDDYTKIDIEIHYADGKKVEYKETK